MPRVIKSYHQRLVVFLTFAVSERETETETERDRETDGERQRETERERERGERVREGVRERVNSSQVSLLIPNFSYPNCCTLNRLA